MFTTDLNWNKWRKIYEQRRSRKCLNLRVNEFCTKVNIFKVKWNLSFYCTLLLVSKLLRDNWLRQRFVRMSFNYKNLNFTIREIQIIVCVTPNNRRSCLKQNTIVINASFVTIIHFNNDRTVSHRILYKGV